VEVLVGFDQTTIQERDVELTLHHSYTIDEAVAAFAPAGDAEFLLDQQFVILPKAVLCMATVGDPAAQPHVSSASRVVWKPGRIDDVPLARRWDAHDKITDAGGPGRKGTKEHHVFLRLPGEPRFLYVGKAHLGSGSAAEANFTLNEKLPRNEWLRLGGYPGWLIDLHDRSERVDIGDLDAFRRLTAEMAGREVSNLRMTRFEEDLLDVYTNARRGWLLYQRDPAEFSYCGRDPAETGLGGDDEEFRCGCCGIVLNASADHTVPRDLAIRVAEHFFTVGELPRTLRWLAD
jgi:hypothetical protein